MTRTWAYWVAACGLSGDSSIGWRKAGTASPSSRVDAPPARCSAARTCSFAEAIQSSPSSEMPLSASSFTNLRCSGPSSFVVDDRVGHPHDDGVATHRVRRIAWNRITLWAS